MWSSVRRARRAPLCPRSFVLGLAVLSLAALGRGQIPDAAPTPPPALPPAFTSPFQPMAKPADPAKVRGTYELDGKTVEVTEGEFYDTYLLLKPNEERPNLPLQPQRVLEHLLSLAEARSLGLLPTAEELELLNPAKTNPAMASQLRERWKALGITEADYLRYLAETKAIQRMKDLWANSSRTRSSEVFEVWKRDNFLYRVAYLEFPSEPHEAALRSAPPDETALRNFWNTNAQVQDVHRTPTCVSADLLVFDPRSVSEAELAARRGAKTFTREQLLAYFRQHKERLVQQIPSDQRPKLYPPAGSKPKPGEIATPFEILKDQIERELALGNAIEAAYEKARTVKDSAGMKALASEFALKHVRIEKVDRAGMLRDHAAYGHQLFTELFNATAGGLSPTVVYQGPVRYFWRLEDKWVSTLPPFEEVRPKLVEDWIRHESQNRAQAEAKALMDSVDARVAAELRNEELAIDKETAEKAEAEITSKQISDDRQKEAIRQKGVAMGEARKRKARMGITPRHFDAVVAERKLTLRELPPFSFVAISLDRNEIKDPREQVEAFLKTSYQVRSLEEGQVSPVLSDVVTRSHFIVKVLGKAEPDFALMPVVDYHQRKIANERQATFTSSGRWNIAALQARRGWKER